MNKKKKFPLMPLFWLAVLILLATKLIFDFVGFRSFIGEAFSFVLSLIGYLLYGFIFAYILNAYMNVWERRVFKKLKNPKMKRTLSIIIAYVSFFAVLVMLVFMIVPTVVSTVASLVSNLPRQVEIAVDYYESILDGTRFNIPAAFAEKIRDMAQGLGDTIISFLNVERITSIFTSTISGIFNLVMGLFVSVYMLLEKDRVMAAVLRMVDALLPDKHSKRLKWAGHQINGIFNKYFIGKLLQASIMLVVSYVGFTVAGLRYTILFAVVMAITNLIPYIGPWIGGVPIVFVSLVSDFWNGVAALICVLIAQSVDNWFVTPKVVGGKMGINPLLVLIGLCVGGALFGIPGMIVGDVMAAVVKVIFYDTYIYKKIQVKVANGELPADYTMEMYEEENKKPGVFEKIKKKFKK